jgi:hypothetical protein
MCIVCLPAAAMAVVAVRSLARRLHRHPQTAREGEVKCAVLAQTRFTASSASVICAILEQGRILTFSTWLCQKTSAWRIRACARQPVRRR